MASKTCRVSCVDLRGIEHAVELSANSLYEAVAQALRLFRDNEWIEGIGRGQTPICVKAKHLEIEHTVRVQDFERWLQTAARSPAEMGLEIAYASCFASNEGVQIVRELN